MKKWLCGALCCGLLACGSVEMPAMQGDIAALRLIMYRDGQGQGLIPVARNVGETRTQLWRRWLQVHQNHWQTMPYEKLSGQTKWCAQWLQNEQLERVCRRDNTLIWFGRGVLRDETALLQAEKIWALK